MGFNGRIKCYDTFFFFFFLLSNGGSYDLVKVTQAKSHRGQQAISMCDTEHGMPLLHVQYINQF